jgi:hypothetical protein
MHPTMATLSLKARPISAADNLLIATVAEDVPALPAVVAEVVAGPPAAPRAAEAAKLPPQPKAPPAPRPAKVPQAPRPRPTLVAAPATGDVPKALNARRAPAGKAAERLADAQRGILPVPPDFTADTHKRFRIKLGELVAMAGAGDVTGLEAFEINPISSSRQAMDRYRKLAVLALRAKQAPAA